MNPNFKADQLLAHANCLWSTVIPTLEAMEQAAFDSKRYGLADMLARKINQLVEDAHMLGLASQKLRRR